MSMQALPEQALREYIALIESQSMTTQEAVEILTELLKTGESPWTIYRSRQ